MPENSFTIKKSVPDTNRCPGRGRGDPPTIAVGTYNISQVHCLVKSNLTHSSNYGTMINAQEENINSRAL